MMSTNTSGSHSTQPNSHPVSPVDKSAAKSTLPKPPVRSGRTRAREFAIQALYQHLVGKNTAEDIDVFTRDLQGFSKADSAHYDALFHGCMGQAVQLDAKIVPHLDRPLAEISPVEHAIMWLGAYELEHCLDVPWRVVLNEYIEQTKAFGGTDGHKYVNGVLNKLAPELRKAEVNSDSAPSNKHGKNK
jgi:transcription antitermination protein NusB